MKSILQTLQLLGNLAVNFTVLFSVCLSLSVQGLEEKH